MKKTSKLKLALGLAVGITAAIWGIIGSKESDEKSTNTTGSGRAKISDALKDEDANSINSEGKGDSISLSRKAERDRVLRKIARAASQLKTQQNFTKEQMVNIVDNIFFPNGKGNNSDRLLKQASEFISYKGIIDYFTANPQDIDGMDTVSTSEFNDALVKNGMDGSEIVFGLERQDGVRALYIMKSNGNVYAYLGLDEYGPLLMQVDKDLAKDIEFREGY